LLSDCLITTQRFPEAVKLLEILAKADPSMQSQYETLKSQTESSKRALALSKQRQAPPKQV